MTLGKPLDLTGRVDGLFGLGSSRRIGELAQEGRVGLVADGNLANGSMIRQLQDRLGATVIDIPAGEPTTEEVQTLVSGLRGYDVVVGVGGGSVLDSVKLAAAVVATGSSVVDHLWGANPLTATLPVIAVPTTAGTGAEVTRTCVVTHNGVKGWAWDDLLRPRQVVLDGDLTRDLPESVTVSSALDAFVHAVEAATARRVVDDASELALAAMAQIHAALSAVIADGKDRQARMDLLTAATAAGLAIDQCGTGVAHALGHALASLATIPHGLAVAFSLREAADFNAETGDALCDDVAGALGAVSYETGIRSLFETVDLDRHLTVHARRGPVEAPSLFDMIRHPSNEPMCTNNIRPPDPDDCLRLTATVAETWNRLGGHG